jgi:hypothetical protein
VGDEQAPIFVGWREWIALPGLGVPGVKAKIDTGARTSALHATAIERFEHDGRDRVRFWVHPLQDRPRLPAGRDVLLPCAADIVDARVVTPSSGHKEHRLVIRTTVRLGGREAEIEITLTDRADMRFRMLLGRQALVALGLCVDPRRSYLIGKRPKKLSR